jgi:hypothetical protein
MIGHFDKIIERTKGIPHGTLFEVNSAFLLQGSKAARHGGPSALKVAWIGTLLPYTPEMCYGSSYQKPKSKDHPT